MKVCNISVCEACELYDSQSFKLLKLSSGRIPRPKKKADRLIFIISGQLSVKTEGQKDLIGEQGQIILLMRDKEYDVDVLEPVEILSLSFITTYQVCDKMKIRDAKRILDTIQYRYCALPIKEPMNIMLQSIIFYLKDDIHCGYWHRAKLTEFFVIFWNYYTLEEICNFFYPIINKDIGFHTKVMANCTKAKTVTELAKLCGYSLSAFNKLFKKHFQHSSPYQWMMKQNVPLIKARLMDESVPIKAILSEFGFTDQSYFNSYCKRYFGVTASQLRKGKD